MTNNSPAEITARYINSTNRHIFLTGKAGTGKTTFLREIVNKTHKNAIVAAPTGIAAINAGGVTLHSLFQLPFGTFLPTENVQIQEYNTIQLSTPKNLLKNLKLNQAKRQLIQSIELLIIDEVSMLRADILDAIDLTLRSIRKKRQIPFGGVQMLFIGDLLQLPPVVKQDERPWLSQFYSSMYFFNALALKDNPPLYIELEKVYRQADPVFIDLLNNLRNNQITSQDIEILNKHYDPEIEKKGLTDSIFITTHNKIADEINNRELEKLNGKTVKYQATIDKEFQPNTYPVELELKLKKGARVMFIKNDYSGMQRYFNGKIGTVTDFDDEGPIVSFNDNTDPFIVENYTWENKRFKLNQETNEIETTVKGTFSHFPLKLAWAVTVHKSQGLTFEKAIIDVSRAFAPGQIYVALSRLTSLNGLILNGKLPDNIPETEATLKEFSKNKKTKETLEDEFKTEAWNYLISFIQETFSFKTLIYTLKDHEASYAKATPQSKKHKHQRWASEFARKPLGINATGEKFIKTIEKLANPSNANQSRFLHERTQAARQYFEKELKEIKNELLEHTKKVSNETGTKGYLKELKGLEHSIWNRIEKLHKAEVLSKAYAENTPPDFKDFIYQPEERLKSHTKKEKKEESTTKKSKTPTHHITFEMIKQGLSQDEIALARSLAASTIETHIAKCIDEKILDPSDIITDETYAIVKKAALTIKSYRIGKLKEVISDEYSWGDIRIAIAAMKIRNDIDEKIMEKTNAEIEDERKAK